MLLPRRLQPGDTIGVVSPSDPVTEEKRGQLDRGVAFLDSLGFKVQPAQNALKPRLTPQEKAADINEMFSNLNIDGVICAQGGDSAQECLDYIDWEIVRRNPKVFMGISDITVLLDAIHAKTGLVTFHGNDVMYGFGRNPTGYNKTEFLDRLVHGKIGPIAADKERKTVRGGVCEGRLIGGNLRCMLKLLDTPYWPDVDGAVLFFEAFHITPEQCMERFARLERAGVFEAVSGVVVGYIYGMQTAKERVTQMEDVLLSATERYDFPILKVNDFGHNTPNTVLPVGGRVRMDAGAQSIEILEKCVS